MSNSYDAIDKALDVKSEIVREKKKLSQKSSDQDDPTKDYEYSRAQLYNLVEKGQEAVNGILDVCQDSQHPRAISGSPVACARSRYFKASLLFGQDKINGM